MNSERLLQRFLRYVRVDTTAREQVDDYPSSSGQLELGRMLVEELAAIGLTDAAQSEHGIVTATLRATVKGDSVIALCSHLDTSPETTGANVQPQVIDNYQGGDITLPGDRSRVIRAEENPELAALAGTTIITADGTTLLGGDDKAGVAVIMETVAYLVKHPDLPHGPVRICFTCDEEIGRGVDHIDLAALGADVCYTLDGQGANEIDTETFSADLATVRVGGVNIQPAIAKGKMINAVRTAGDFLARLPRELSPETTEGRDGFVHPYTIEGGVAQVAIRILLRDFDTAELARQADVLRRAAVETEKAFPGAKISVDVSAQYRNMADGLRKEPRAVAYAVKALENLERTPNLTTVRGGTDGSRLTELGLPTPNLSTGEHNPHSPLEWASLREMELAVEMLVELLAVWACDVGV